LHLSSENPVSKRAFLKWNLRRYSPGFKLRGLVDEEGACPGNAAAATAALLRRWSKSAGKEAVNAIEAGRYMCGLFY
jgi:hypothetical protein